ncbi:unnamed protein product [Musa acuminata subsp. burmannicoides]
MGDEGHAKASAAEPPAIKKRARDGGDLKRVAEIVMVLSAMGQMRGGRQPTAAEKALVAEARERLVAMCEGVKPKELFSGEAVRVVVEDLGLNRSKDPVMGFRPPKMSIADKLLLTKKKTEGALGVNTVKTSHQMMINHETKPSMMQAGQGTLQIVHQPSQGLTVVHTPGLFTNHNDIAKNIQRILQANISDHPSWTPPSTEYMNSTLNCQVCKNAITDIESLLVCDACEKGNHLKCLQSYGNKGIPKAEWHCPRCLASSNGKPLPPKYGRVTRAPIGAPKATSNASIHASSKKTENLDKVNQQKAIPSGISGVSQHAYSLNEEGKHHDPVPDSRTTSPEVQVTLTTVGDKRANETCNLIGCNNLKEISGPICTPPGTHCEDTNNIGNNRLSLAGTKPTAESVLQPRTASENFCEHSHDMDVENNHLSKVPFAHNFDQMKLPSDGKSPANELDKDAKLAMTKPEEALGEKNLPENIDGCNARLANEGSTQSTADRDGYTMNQKANLG